MVITAAEVKGSQRVMSRPLPLEAGNNVPGRHHQETKSNEHAREPNTESDNQDEPKTHPVYGDGAEEHHQSRRTRDYPPVTPKASKAREEIVSPGAG